MSSAGVGTPPTNWTSNVSVLLVLVLLLALAFRLATFNGMFGSDDLVYYARATLLANGDWTSANYNGALRYGFNLPAAGFIALFGESPFIANLWPLVCSLIEIGAVYAFTNAVMNRRAALFAALLLATAPLHMAVSTRIHADPVVSMFLTVSFVMLYFGLQRNRSALLFGAGLSIGGIFWAKELAAVTWFAFLPLLWFFRGRWPRVLPVIAGTVLIMLLHLGLMTVIAGDPLHLVKVVLGALTRNFIDGAQGEDAATYYLHYLFVDLRHVGVLAYLALASLWLTPRWLGMQRQPIAGFSFVLIWWIGVIAILSVFPVSFSPLRFTMKQSNYITLFLAPTAALAGMALASIPRWAGRLAVALTVCLGLLLGALQQADYRVFTANSKAVAALAVEYPQALVVGSQNNSQLGNFWARLEYPGAPSATIFSFRDIVERPSEFQAAQGKANAIFAVLDRQTMNWFAGALPVTKPLACWMPLQSLSPQGLGLGNALAASIYSVLHPFRLADEMFARLALPQRADVYRVNGIDVLCRGG